MSVNSLSPQKGHDDVLNVNDVENMSPKQNGKPVSPVLSIVKVKPLIDAINTRNGNRDIFERENTMVDTQVWQETEPEVVEPLDEDTSAKSFLDQNASILNAHEIDESSIALQSVFEELGKEDICSVDLPMAVAEEHEQQVTLPPVPPVDHLMPSSSNAQISDPTRASSLAQNRPGSSVQSTNSFKILLSSAASGREVENSKVSDSTTSAHSNSVEVLTKKQTTKSKIHSNAELPKKRSPNSANMVTVTSSAAAKSARASALAAKEAATAERIKKVAELKSKWKEEHELKMNANKLNRQAELNLLKQMSNKASEQRRTKLEQQRQFDDNEKLRHRVALQEKQADQKKQTEVLNLRAKDARIKAQQQKQRDMKAVAEAEKLLLAKKKEEEANLLESRRLDHIRLKEAKRLEEEEKRMAAVARGAVAMEQREISSELQHTKKLEEIDRMEVRRQHWEDDRSANEKQQRSRRESLSGRLDAWRSERAQSAKLQESEQICAMELLQDRQNNWQALQAYKLDESTSRRQSLAGRLDCWRAEKKQFTEQQEQEEEARLLERELKDAEVEDVRRHKASIEENRRSSLAQRLEKARIDKDHEQAEEAVRQELEMESRRIATQDQEDVRKNKSMILAARRQVSNMHACSLLHVLCMNDV